MNKNIEIGIDPTASVPQKVEKEAPGYNVLDDEDCVNPSTSRSAEMEMKMMPQALELFGDIAQVLVWAQSFPNSGVRKGTYQVCIGLLTNSVRLRAILVGKETIEDFTRDCLEKDCPELCRDIIAKNAKEFLYGNYAAIDTIQGWLEDFDIDPKDFRKDGPKEGESSSRDILLQAMGEHDRLINILSCEVSNGKPKYTDYHVIIEEALKRCHLLSAEGKERLLKQYQTSHRMTFEPTMLA